MKNNKIPLSYEQERLWFLEQMDPGNPAYNRPYVLRFTGLLRSDILQRSLNLILLRHDILGAQFSADNGIPYFVITPHEDIGLKVTDISGLAESDQAAALDSIILDEARRSFDLKSNRPVRFELIHSSATEHVLVAVFHHLVFDGWSAQILLRELAVSYNAYLHSSEPILPDLPINFAEYASTQRELLSGPALDRELAYWKGLFPVEPPVLELPLDRPRPLLQEHIGSAYVFAMPVELTDNIKTFCRSERVTLFMYLLTILKILMFRYTHQQEIVVGCLAAGRSDIDAEKLIGFFVNTLPVKTTLEGNLSFRELLLRVRVAALGTFSHQQVPYAKLLAELSPSRNQNINPLFQVMLNLHNMPRTVTTVEGLTIEELDYDYGISPVDICLKVTEQNGTIVCNLIYDTEIFEVETIARMASHFQMIIQGSVADPDEKISRLPLLTDTERISLLKGASRGLVAPCHKKCIHQYFEEQAALAPQKIALLFGDRELTYGELNKRANRLAHYLQEKGVGSEAIVAVGLEQSLDRIVCLLAVLKAGGAYLPLDVLYPAERLSFMLEDSKTEYILVSQATEARVEKSGTCKVCLEADLADIIRQSEDDLSCTTGPDNLAYVIYTSGSTGNPKGVAVLHKGITRLVKDIDYAHLGPEEVFLQLTTIAFDVSAFEIYGSLLNGGKLVMMDSDRPSMADIGTKIEQYKVTSLCIAPETLQALLDECRHELLGLRQVLAAGDVLPVALAVRFRERLPDCRLINAYGPTENSVYTTAYAVDSVSSDDRYVPIGRPIAADCVYILDKHLELLPVRIIGELYAAGDGVAREYLHNPKLTADRFVSNPFSTEPDSRLYKTGDLARYLPDGNIEFVGRADNQVKIRGCRIELREIETVVCQHPDIKHCIMTVSTNQEGLKTLVAYVVMTESVQLRQNELRSFAKLKLPDYMVPSLYIAISQVPLTPAGKLDRQALPEPQFAADSGRKTVAPRSNTEKRLVKIWANLLKLPKVSVQDGFFDLGGHSLLAMKLFADIERTFNKKLPVSILFQEDTIEKLAAVIDGDILLSATANLVPIQSLGKKLPLFCVHDIDGEVIAYRNLALYLGKDQPLYGLKLGLIDVTQISVEDLAEKYIGEIRKVQPRGPYLLAGHSFGGIVVFEMSQQLSRQGQDISLVAIFDTQNPQNNRFRQGALPRKTFSERLAKSYRKFINSGTTDIPQYISAKLKAEGNRFNKRITNLLIRRNRLEKLRQENIRQALLRAHHEYRPVWYSGTITLFRAMENDFFQETDDDLGWREVANKVTVHNVPGDHGTMIAQQNSLALVTHLKESLREVQKQ